MLNAPEHVNFFENRSTEYSKASHGWHLGTMFWPEVRGIAD